MIAEALISTFLGSVVSGIVGGRADALASKSLDMLGENIHKNHRFINHDLQKAVLKSYYRSIKNICEECQKLNLGDDENRWMEEQIQEIKRIVSDIDRDKFEFMVIPDLDRIRLILTTEDRLDDEMVCLEKELIGYAVSIGNPPLLYRKLVEEKLMVNIKLLFAYEVKHNQVIANILQSQLLSNLDIKVDRLYRNMLKQLEEELPQINHSLEAIEKSIEKSMDVNQDYYSKLEDRLIKSDINTSEKFDILMTSVSQMSDNLSTMMEKGKDSGSGDRVIQASKIKGYAKRRLEGMLNMNRRLYSSRFFDAMRANISIAGKQMNGIEGLMTLWKQSCRHALVEGGGGTGKTTLLVAYWMHLCDLEDKGIVPIYIPLNEYRGQAGFIKARLCEILGCEWKDHISVKEMMTRIMVEPNDREYPSFVIMLDGFNELPTEVRQEQDYNQGLLIGEVEELLELDRVQVIISSRSDLRSENYWDYINHIKMTRLDDDQISLFFNELGNEREVSLPEGPLLNLVRNPLMLSIYCQISPIMNQYRESDQVMMRSEIKTQGDLLWNYIEVQRLKSCMHLKNRQMASLRSYILDHILPYIAYKMQSENVYHISGRELNRLIMETVHRLEDPVFIDYNETYAGLGKRIDDISGPDIRKIICSEMGLMTEVKEEGYRKKYRYHFNHQLFRDYLAGYYLFTDMVLMMDMMEEGVEGPVSQMNQKIHEDCLVLLGDILVEGHNVPRLEDKEWSIDHYYSKEFSELIHDFLEVFRESVEVEKQEAYQAMIGNIISIMILARGELTGADLSKLDLRGINLNGVICSRQGLEQKIGLKLDGAVIGDRTFLPDEKGHKLGIKHCCFGPKRSRILTASDDFTIKEWDKESGQLIRTYIGHEDKVYYAVYNQDETKILSCSWDKTVKEWDVESGQCLTSYYGHTNAINMVMYDQEEEVIYSAGDDYLIGSWKVNEDIEICEIKTFDKVLKGHSDWVNSISLTRIKGEDILLSASADGRVLKWYLDSGEYKEVFDFDGKKVRFAAYNEKKGRFLLTFEDPVIGEYDEDGNLLNEYRGHRSFVRMATYVDEESRILSVSDDHSVRLWEIDGKHNSHKTILGHVDAVMYADYDKDGFVLTGSGDGTCKLWKVETLECMKIYSAPATYGVKMAVFNGDETRCLMACLDGSVVEWDLVEDRCHRVFTGHTGKVMSAVYSKSQKKILSGSVDGSIKEWDYETGLCLHTYKEHRSFVYSAWYWYDENGLERIVSSSADGSVKVWSPGIDKALHTFNHPSRVYEAACFIDKKIIYTACRDGQIYAWSCEREDEAIQKLKVHDDVVEDIRFIKTEDEAFLMTGSNNGEYAICKLDQDGKMMEKDISYRRIHDLGLVSLAYDRRNGFIFSGSRDKTIKKSRLEDDGVISYEDHGHWVNNISLSKDYRTMLSASTDSSVGVWDLEHDRSTACVRYIPGLFIQGCDFGKVNWTGDQSALVRLMKYC